MAPASTFDGALAGGELFAGKKFFFQQRIPMRQHYVELCKANGGNVVKLDKQADIIIADHKKKDAPPGSISWKYIDESVKQGQLLEMTDFLAGPPKEATRAHMTGKPAKATRNPFTSEDDRILMECVVRAERECGPTMGNEIYKNLAMKYPRHTYQSWRDRWIKYVKDRPRPALSDSECDSDDQEPIIRTVERPSFTEAEEEELIISYDDILNVDPTELDKAWDEWTKVDGHQTHTAAEWKNRFENVIKPRVEKERERKQDAHKHENPEPPAANGAAEDEVDSEDETPDLAVESARPTTEPSREVTSSTASTFITEANFCHDYKLFIESQKARDADLEVVLDFSPTIEKTKISLYNLAKTVMHQFGGYDAVEAQQQWTPVAEALGFNRFKHRSAPAELKSCYEDSLLHEFEEIVGMVQEINEEDVANGDDAVVHEIESMSVTPGQKQPGSSSGVLHTQDHNGKRRRDDETHRGSSGSSRKRPRSYHEAESKLEIPSTPEHILSGSGRHDDSQGDESQSSPTPTRITRQRKTSSENDAPAASKCAQPMSATSSTSSLSSTFATKSTPEDALSRWIAHYEARGYTTAQIARALHATTMEVGAGSGLAPALAGLARHGDLPAGTSGIWTARDDAALAKTGLKEYRRVVELHGQARVEARREFLRLMG